MNITHGPKAVKKLKIDSFHASFVGGISIVLFYLIAAVFFYAAVKLMDAFNVINMIQNIVMIVLGICVGLIGFFLFKKLFLKVLAA